MVDTTNEAGRALIVLEESVKKAQQAVPMLIEEHKIIINCVQSMLSDKRMRSMVERHLVKKGITLNAQIKDKMFPFGAGVPDEVKKQRDAEIETLEGKK